MSLTDNNKYDGERWDHADDGDGDIDDGASKDDGGTIYDCIHVLYEVR